MSSHDESPQDRPPLLHDPAPDFEARTTMGVCRLSDYRGRWLLFFAHPADFTPVCASEFVALARAEPRFAELDCAMLGISVDSLYSHLAWLRSLEARFGVRVNFPLIEDPSMAIVSRYGMVSPRAPDSALVRGVFVIDPAGIIRAIQWYPATTGRSVEELLRLVAALQATDAHGVSTPEGWHPGDDVLYPAPLTMDAADMAVPENADWYYRPGEPPAPKPTRKPARKPAATKRKTRR